MSSNRIARQAKKNLHSVKCIKCKEEIWSFIKVKTKVPINDTTVFIAYKSTELQVEYTDTQGKLFNRSYKVKYNCRMCRHKVDYTISDYMFKLLYL